MKEQQEKKQPCSVEPPEHDIDMAFTISSVESFHLLVEGQNYWQSYRSGNSLSTERFLLKPGWRTVYASQVETALVKVTFDDGSVGWGEATEPICPEVICKLASNLLAPVLGARRWHSPDELWCAAYDLNRCRGHHSGYLLLAMAALDVAVWDAVSRRANLPLASAIARYPKDKIHLYVSGLRRGSVEQRIELLSAAIKRGFAGAKIFVDADTPNTSQELAALRSGVPGDWLLMVDALWSYDNAQSAAVAKQEFQNFDVNWLECPMISEDLNAHRELAQYPGVRIGLGEHFFTQYQSASWIESGVMDVFQLDICRTGLSNGLRQAQLARDAGIKVTPHMGSGSPVVQAAALQFGAAIDADEPCEFQYDLEAILPSVFQSDWKEVDGHAALPNSPGLGINLDDAALASHSVLIERWRKDAR